MKTWKFIITGILFCSFAIISNCKAQDVIYKKDGSEVKAKVTEITDDLIKYKNFDQPNGPLRSINKTDVFFIIYEDGTREVIQSGQPEKKNDTGTKTSGGTTNTPTTTPQNKPEKNQSHTVEPFDFDFGFGGGIFSCASKGVKTIYGNPFPMFGMNFTFWVRRFAVARIDIGVTAKTGTMQTVGTVENPHTQLRMIPVSLSLLYRIKNRGDATDIIYPYFGMGFGVNNLQENSSGEFVFTDATGSRRNYFEMKTTRSPFDLSFIAGFKVKFFYLEFKYSYNKISDSNGVAKNSENSGGLWVMTGFRW